MTKEKEQKWLEEEINIEFQNLEEPGLMVTFTYGSTRNAKKYTLMHGGKYKLPRKLIQHIQTRSTPIYEYRPNDRGVMQKTLTGTKSRFQCREVFA